MCESVISVTNREPECKCDQMKCEVVRKSLTAFIDVSFQLLALIQPLVSKKRLQGDVCYVGL